MRKPLALLSVALFLVTAPACSAPQRSMTAVEQYNASLRAKHPRGVVVAIDTSKLQTPEPGAMQLTLGAGDRLGTHLREVYLARKAGKPTEEIATVVIHNDD